MKSMLRTQYIGYSIAKKAYKVWQIEQLTLYLSIGKTTEAPRKHFEYNM